MRIHPTSILAPINTIMFHLMMTIVFQLKVQNLKLISKILASPHRQTNLTRVSGAMRKPPLLIGKGTIILLFFEFLLNLKLTRKKVNYRQNQ